MSEEPTTEAYNHTHRAFLQAFLSHPTLTLPTARPILAAILTAASPSRPTLPADITDADFQSYIAAINASLSPLDYEIRSTRDQKDRSAVLIWALVNTTSDGLTQLATTYSADEIAFVKRVLDAMFETNNTARAEIMAVTGMQALKLHRAAGGVRAAQVDGDGEQTQGSAGQGLTMAAAERVLASLVQEGWFERSKSGFYSLSPRALMELRGWLIETYNEPAGEEEDEVEVVRIRVCQACREIVTVVSTFAWACHGGCGLAMVFGTRKTDARHRVRDVRIWTVAVGFTTSARGISSGSRARRGVRSARRRGMTSIRSVRRRRERAPDGVRGMLLGGLLCRRTALMRVKMMDERCSGWT